MPYISILVLILLAAGMWRLAKSLDVKQSTRVTVYGAMALLPVLLGLFLSHHPNVTIRWFPSVYYFDFRWWFIPFGLFLIGIGVQQKVVEDRVREAVLFRVLALALLVFMVFDWSQHLPPPGKQFQGEPLGEVGVCKQSTGYSCTAAAVTTLLYQHGIATDEQEMVWLCRTGYNGTQTLGAMYGLQEKCKQANLHPVLKKIRGKVAIEIQFPSLASIQLPGGVHHSICLLEYNRHRNTIKYADPLKGIVQTDVRLFKEIWQGDCVYLASADSEK